MMLFLKYFGLLLCLDVGYGPLAILTIIPTYLALDELFWVLSIFFESDLQIQNFKELHVSLLIKNIRAVQIFRVKLFGERV